MADPIKLQVLRALTTHLEGIKGADYHDLDLTGAVFRGRNRYGEDDPSTMISILEAPRPDGGREAGDLGSSRSFEWELLLQGWTDDDPANPSDPAYLLEDAIIKRLNMLREVHDSRTGMPGNPRYPDVYLLGRLITNIDFGYGVVRPPTDNLSSKAYLYFPLKVGLAVVV